MTVSNELVKELFTGNGSTTSFTIPFAFNATSDIEVYLRDEVDPDAITETIQVEGTDYDLTGGPPVTTVEMVTAPAATEKLLVRRQLDLTQSTDYITADSFPADSHETALDKITFLIQQMKELSARSLVLPITTTLDSIILPEPENFGVLKWNSDSTAIILDTALGENSGKAAVSSNDTTQDYLLTKILGGTGITITENNNGSNETMTIADDGQSLVSSNDTTHKYLQDAIVGGDGITVSTLNDGADEDVNIAHDGTGLCSSNDTTVGYLEDKITGGNGVLTSTLNDAGDEDVDVRLGGDITLNASDFANGLSVNDAATPTANDLLSVNNNDRSTKYLLVDDDQVRTEVPVGIYGTPGSESAFDVVSTTKTSRPFPTLTTTQRDALSSPDTGSGIYNSTVGGYQVYNGSSWLDVGSAPDNFNNYITDTDDQDFELTVGSWAGYDLGATATLNASPSTGTATNFPLTRNTTTPIQGDADGKITKAAFDSQGEGCSLLVTFPLVSQSSVVEVSFDIDASDSNYVDADCYVEFWDETNSARIELSQRDLLGGKGKYKGYFQAPSDLASGRIAIHCATTNANAYNLFFKNVYVGKAKKSFGEITSEWESWTPTGAWTAGTWYGKKKRVGDTGYYWAMFVASGATTGNCTINMPSGEVMDTTKMPTTMVGTNSKLPFSDGFAYDNGTGAHHIAAIWNSSTVINARPYRADGTYAGNGSAVNATIPMTWASGDQLEMFWQAPIVGWGALGKVAEIDDGRLIGMSARVSSNQSVGSGSWTKISLATVTFDTHAAFDETTNYRWTCPKTGKYSVNGAIRWGANGTNDRGVTIYKNGAEWQAHAYCQAGDGNYTSVNCNAIYDLVKGDYLELYGWQNSGGNLNAENAGTGQTHMDIFEIAGGSGRIHPSENIVARYLRTSTQTVTDGNNDIIDYATADFDSHSAVTTGASWKFTAPISGYYRVDASVFLSYAATVDDNMKLAIYKNGTEYSILQREEADASVTKAHTVGGSDIVSLDKGDYIDVRLEASGSNGPVSNSKGSRISISLIH
jgi:hypothetical protein